jgi:hypothetical protein
MPTSGIGGLAVRLAAALTAAAGTAHAAEVRPVIVAGYDTGGDQIKAVTFQSGENDSIRANEGLYLGGGVSVLNDAGNVEFLGSLSLKYQRIHASNADITWTRIPLDALVFYRMQSFRLGGGLTYVLHPRLKGSGDASSTDTAFPNALGAVLQGDYLLGRVSLGVRYTVLDYKSGGSTVKSNGLGVSFGIAF